MMKISYDAKRAFQNNRGLGNYSRNLLDGMIRFYPENKLTLYGVSPQNNFASEWIKRIENKLTIEQPVNSCKLYQAYWRSFGINNNIKNNTPDIFHGLGQELPRGKKIENVKYIVTIHDLLIYRIKDLFNPIDRKIYEIKIKSACKKADLILAISKQTKSDIINYLNVPEEKIVIGYQSCSSRFYDDIDVSKKISVKEKYNLPDKYLLYVGALIKHKNVKLIIEAISILHEDSKIPLVIVGNGESYKKELLKQISLLNLTKRVLFLDYVPDIDISTIYQLATIFVWPSFFEGFGIPILEAMFSNTPVITSKGGCFSEVGGNAAKYINPNDKEELAYTIENILSDEKILKEMQSKGREQALNFHIKNTTERMNQIYSSLL